LENYPGPPGTPRTLALSADGTTVVLGVPREFILTPNSGGEQGAVYVFRKSGSTWAQEQKIGPGTLERNFLGAKVSIDTHGQTMAIWKYYPDTGGNYWFVDVYRHDTSGWTRIKELPTNTYGYHVNNFAMSGDGQVLVTSNAGGAIEVYTAPAFTLAQTPYNDRPFEACHTWMGSVLEKLRADPPDYVVTSQGQSHAYASDGTLSREAMVAGLRAIWHELTSRGTKIVVIADNPHPGREAYDCVAKNLERMSVCAFDREPSDAAETQYEAVKDQAGVSIVDLLDAICPTDRCAPVIGNVLLYRQGSHLTKTYVETLTPRLAAALTGAGLSARYAR